MKLENLISELCPNGVVYSPLGTLCKIETGKLNANAMDENGIYPFFTCDAKPFKINTYAFDTEAILVSGNGSQVGHINYYNGKFNAYQRTYVLSGFNGIHVGFLLHYLQGYLREHIYVNSRKGSVPYITLPMLQDFRIPLPLLPVQQEIVHILDNFTELTAELTAELAARRKQYEHYRDELLTFGDDVPVIKLGETCIMKSGKAIASANIVSQADSTNTVPCFGGNGIRGFVRTASHCGEYPIIGRQGALCGNVCYATGNFYATEHAVVVNSQGNYHQRFLYHLLSAMKLNQYKSQGAQPGLAVSNIENIFAPVPPIEVQCRIYKILDRFDTLCNDLTSGLPAEIAARQKQYEYYRDKLLTFKELEG